MGPCVKKLRHDLRAQGILLHHLFPTVDFDNWTCITDWTSMQIFINTFFGRLPLGKCHLHAMCIFSVHITGFDKDVKIICFLLFVGCKLIYYAIMRVLCYELI